MNWENVAVQLHFDDHTIMTIKRDSQQPDCACHSMFTEWLNGKGRKPVTWRRLVNVLYEADLSSVAQELDKMITD